MSTVPFMKRVFFLIQRHDPELAEMFCRLVDCDTSKEEINQFFIGVVNELPARHHHLLDTLTKPMGPITWLNHFEDHVLPVLIRFRFPPLPEERQDAFYRPRERTVTP